MQIREYTNGSFAIYGRRRGQRNGCNRTRIDLDPFEARELLDTLQKATTQRFHNADGERKRVKP